MTDRPAVARLCPCCCARFCPVEQRRCSDCDSANPPPQRAASPKAPRRPEPLPQSFAGISLEEALERYGPPIDGDAAREGLGRT